jgi:hypothetical protein
MYIVSSDTFIRCEPAAHLATGVMAEIAPFDVETTVVECVDHLVNNRVLHMFLAEKSVLAQQNAMFWMEPSGSGRWAGMTLNRCGCKRASRQS